MTERIEQRYCIKFCQKLGDTQVETIFNNENEALSPTQIKQWFKRFKMAVHQWKDPRFHKPKRGGDGVREKVLEDRR